MLAVVPEYQAKKILRTEIQYVWEGVKCMDKIILLGIEILQLVVCLFCFGVMTPVALKTKGLQGMTEKGIWIVIFLMLASAVISLVILCKPAVLGVMD